MARLITIQNFKNLCLPQSTIMDQNPWSYKLILENTLYKLGTKQKFSSNHAKTDEQREVADY